MRPRILLRITSCVLVAVIVFLVPGSLLYDLDEALGVRYRECATWLGKHGVPEPFLNALYMVEQALAFVVSFVLGLFVFDRIVMRPDGYTRCGSCGRILEHLSKPQCPACLSRI